MKVARINDSVSIHFICMTDEGIIFSTRDRNHPVLLKIGEGKLLKHIENGILGMKINEKKRIKIPFTDAYGKWDKNLVQQIDRVLIPEIMELNAGMEIFMNLQDGSEVKLRIVEVNDRIILVDQNHLLAGKDLIFELELIDIE